MNKALIIGIVIVIVIGTVFAITQLDKNDDAEQVIIEETKNEPKSYTVELRDSLGVTQGKP